MPSLIDHCPSCSGALHIRELHCPTCDITIRGDFDPPTLRGNALTDEQEAFLRLFVLSRGNMSDVERNLGVSYPTVRAKLDILFESPYEERLASALELLGVNLANLADAAGHA